MPRALLLTLAVPVVLILVAIPLILEKIPRNPLYGFRTAYTMSSDEVWFRANKISGVALLIAGFVWLCLGMLLPAVMASMQSAVKLARLFGLGSVTLAVAASFWLTYKK
jgi:uncharacterized membrane protein